MASIHPRLLGIDVSQAMKIFFLIVVVWSGLPTHIVVPIKIIMTKLFQKWPKPEKVSNRNTNLKQTPFLWWQFYYESRLWPRFPFISTRRSPEKNFACFHFSEERMIVSCMDVSPFHAIGSFFCVFGFVCLVVCVWLWFASVASLELLCTNQRPSHGRSTISRESSSLCS